ncbi:hypothetical protein [Salinisphaera hydrothermalis]|uniref:Uncharacterized protein n=1 Tax=Salinisphaera hydrothermalis (strain C41B8) TaxID=1304275 RepID=A0A084IHE2_SALHC|nr:hypothetical protein [Salinisphaera hydrothermalis]KEZ76126.1 hypothetical protein C41B8_16669 [Salinisphaera hydrothermalis C41B8]
MQTPFIGQLEPAALLQHLRTHPPAGFALASTVGGTPTFATRFDLLTTADAPLRERIRGLPLYRVWGRLLRPRTRFIGATASEYVFGPAV